MAAPTNDNILPPLVFLVSLLAAFITLTLAMNTTISSNLESDWTQTNYRPPPDYMAQYYDGTWAIWTPSMYPINDANMSQSWPIDNDDGYQTTFTSALESSHEIDFFTVSTDRWHDGNVTGLFFHQTGGWLGLQEYDDNLYFPENFEGLTDDTGELVTYQSDVQLRHAYRLILSGNNESSITLYEQVTHWLFNVSLYHVLEDDASANPWTIVGQFFTFRLPGVPTWLNVLLAAPFMIMIGVIAYILIRGALPA